MGKGESKKMSMEDFRKALVIGEMTGTTGGTLQSDPNGVWIALGSWNAEVHIHFTDHTRNEVARAVLRNTDSGSQIYLSGYDASMVMLHNRHLF